MSILLVLEKLPILALEVFHKNMWSLTPLLPAKELDIHLGSAGVSFLLVPEGERMGFLSFLSVSQLLKNSTAVWEKLII